MRNMHMSLSRMLHMISLILIMNDSISLYLKDA